MMRIGTAAGVFALAVLGRTTLAWGADYWVATNGSDAAAGSQGAPWATIQHAVDSVQPGDSVTVTDGSYAGFWMKNRAGDAQHRFTIRAQHVGGARITGPSPTASDPNDAIQLLSVSFATIDGFDVTGAPRAGVSIRTIGDVTGADTRDDVVSHCRSHDNGAGVTAGRHDGIFTGFAQNVLLENNEVDHNAEHGIYVSNSADNPVVRGNRSHDNKANGLQINADLSSGGDGVISHWLMENNVVYGNGGAAAVNLDGATFGTLRNNLVYRNANGGVALFKGDAAEASHDNVVVNNTVYNPNGTRFGIQINDGADNNVVFDNVFWSSAAGMEVGAVHGLVHDYNVVSSYSGGSASTHEPTTDSMRLFVDPKADDYHGGPALLGQGTGSLAGISSPALDLSGNARPQGGSYDIGCYQHGGTTPRTPPTTQDPGGNGAAAGGAPIDAAIDVAPPAERDAGGATIFPAPGWGTDAGAHAGSGDSTPAGNRDMAPAPGAGYSANSSGCSASGRHASGGGTMLLAFALLPLVAGRRLLTGSPAPLRRRSRRGQSGDRPRPPRRSRRRHRSRGRRAKYGRAPLRRR
jgi:parallel beta-helix repeat protein